MSVGVLRGGFPCVFRATIDDTGRVHDFRTPINAIVARNKGAAIVRMYFTLEDFTADANFVQLPVAAATAPHGEWAGPAGDLAKIWLRSESGTNEVEVVGFQRLG